jgi:hypothetical protein
VEVITFAAMSEVERTFCIDFVLLQAKRPPRLAGAEGRTGRAGGWGSHRHDSGGHIGWSVIPCGCRHDPRSHDPHHAAAVGTGERRTRADRGGGLGGVDPEQEVQQLDQPLAVGVEEAEVARPAQTLAACRT